MNIQITTVTGTVDVTGLVLSAKWSGDYQQAARALDFAIVASAADESVPVIDCPLGAGVRMTHGGTVLFDGFLVSRQKSTDSAQITLNCYDRGFYLKRNKANYKFTDTTPEAIAAQVVADFGLTAGTLAATGVPVSRNFLGVTLYDILATVYTLAARATGKQYHIGFRADKLCVTVKEPDDRTLILQGKSNLIAANTTESIEKLVSAVAVCDANGNPVRMIEDGERLKLYGRMQEVLRQTDSDDKAAQAQKLLDDGGATQKITVDCLGNVANVTGGTVVVREPYTGLYGLFYIDSDLHEWKRGQYYNKLVLNFKSIMDEREAGSLPNADGGKTAGTADAGLSFDYVNKPGGENAG